MSTKMIFMYLAAKLEIPRSVFIWGYSVQKMLWGCAANMGSKISILVYE